jgi:hypothetical protein
VPPRLIRGQAKIAIALEMDQHPAISPMAFRAWTQRLRVSVSWLHAELSEHQLVTD